MSTTITGSGIRRVPMSEIRSRYGGGEGRHWFDPATMRWFNCRLPRSGVEGPGGCYFVSSERDSRAAAWDGQRRYTVQRLDGPGKIETVGEFGGFDDGAAALAQARRLAQGDAS